MVRQEAAVALTDVEVLCLPRKALNELPQVDMQACVIDQNQQRMHIENRKRAALLLAKTDLVAVRYLGFGTFGRVMLVRHRGTSQLFALKSLSKGKLIQQRQASHARCS